jgi:hypothetical protein
MNQDTMRRFKARMQPCVAILLVFLVLGGLGEYMARRLYEKGELSLWGTVSSEQKSVMLDGLLRDPNPKRNLVVVIGGPLLATGIWSESMDARSHAAHWDVKTYNLATLDGDWSQQRRWLADLFANKPPYMVVVDAQALRHPNYSARRPYWHPTAWRYQTVCHASAPGSLLAALYCPLAYQSYLIQFMPNMLDAVIASPQWLINPGWYYASVEQQHHPMAAGQGTIIWSDWGGKLEHVKPTMVPSSLLEQRLVLLIKPYQRYATKWIIVDSRPHSSQMVLPSTRFNSRNVHWFDAHLPLADYADETHFNVMGLLHLTTQLESHIVGWHGVAYAQ